MKILYYDCFAGISGDMNLGAMLDLGIEKDYLISELKKLTLSGYHIHVKRDQRRGIEGTKIEVKLSHHKHKDNDSHKHHDHSSHKHRNLEDIEKIIDASSLNDTVKSLSKAIFKKLAQAEAKVHGKSINEIHFHEVGAVDSIIDIVGAAICFDYLKVDKVLCSTVELGSGFVKCNHGTLPVPAPATVEILQNVPTKKGTLPFETTTPTGAAILATLVDEFTDKTEFTITKVAYGIGHTEAEIPNALRVFLGEGKLEPSLKNDTTAETATIIDCNIDDMNPELYEYIIEKLFNNGADDVYITPIIMKKSRPAITLSVLCNKSHEDAVLEILFTETTTLGIRKYDVDKVMLQRSFSKIDTPFGQVTVKSGLYNGKTIKAKPEYNECKKIAEEKNIPIQEVYKEINSIINKKKI
jgi:uncharacterized protein (TIGR00299 family) protein